MKHDNIYENNPTAQTDEKDEVKWYVMRDLTYTNDKSPAYKVLKESGFEVFTPMTQRITTKRGVKVREEVPFIHDLLFVHSSKEKLDTKVNAIRTLQYRYFRGGKHCEGMTVDNHSMTLFINAVKSNTKCNLYQPSELTEKQIGASIRIIGGTLDGYEGNLLKIQGSKKKRLLIKIKEIIIASVEIEPEYIQVTEEQS